MTDARKHDAEGVPSAPHEEATGALAHAKRGRLGRALRWLFWRHLCFGGLVGALVFFCLSLTPSLLPRGWLFQGIVSGITVAIGYGLGSAASALARKAMPREPSTRTKRIAWLLLLVGTLVLIPLFFLLGTQWQETVRELMGMDSLEGWEWFNILVLTGILALVLLVVSRFVRGGTRLLVRLLDRFLPRAAAYGLGVALAVVIVVGFVQGFLFDGMVSAVNSAYSLTDKDTSPGISQPLSSLRSGGPGSLVPWESLGVQGRDFTGDGGGPSVEKIADFNGGQAEEPIRVFVGLESAGSVEERVDLAMAELERTGAFDREVLAVMTTTGTGWIDPNVADALEYMYAGDSALVGLQYSYLPSWISFLVDRTKAAEAGRELIGAVSERWAALPEDSRPTLLVFGESLGSYGTEQAFSDLDDITRRTDGALLVGPPFANALWGELTANRDEGSPEWRPAYEGGETVRFAVEPEDLDEPATPWFPPRVMYLQNSSDPITWFSFDLLYRSPGWLDDPRGPDVSPDMTWFPVITFWQTAADLVFSTGVPAGHGHRYGANVVDAWAAVAPPPRWTDADTQRLRAVIGHD